MRRHSVIGLLLLSLGLVAPGHPRVQAQTRLVSLVAQDQGHVALGLAIRKLNVYGALLQTAAHPDDEHNQLYALLTHGQGLRSICVQTTRGAGGQNEIGPELFQDIAVLRTSELMSAHRLDGAEQRFTRAIDYGYSFDPQEVLDLWNRKEVVGDVVRFIRTFRPDVVLTMNIQGRGGDRAHEATAIVVRDAYRAAGDPTQFPEQIKDGLRPWQARKLYFTGGPGAGVIGGPPTAGARPGAPPATAPGGPTVKLATVNAAIYDPLLGRTYAEIGADARSNHKCQGMGQLPPLPAGLGGGRGIGGSRYQLVDTTIPGQKDKDESSLFEGIDTSLTAIAQFAGPTPPEALKSGLAAVAAEAVKARTAFETLGDAATAAPIAAGLTALRTLRGQLGSMGLAEDARYEIDFRLGVKEKDYEQALIAAHGLAFEALADDGLVIGGQPLKLSLAVVNRGATDVAVTAVAVAGLDGQAVCEPGTVKPDAAFTCQPELKVPAHARLTTRHWTDEYWGRANPKDALDIFDTDVEFGAPFRPSPFRVTFRLEASGLDIAKELVVHYRHVKDIFLGESRFEPSVVPAFSVRMTPAIAVVPVAAKPDPRHIQVSVTNGTRGPAQATLALEAPAGWTVVPPTAPLAFTSEDEALTVRFEVTAPPAAKPGDYVVRAVVTSPATGAERFSVGYQEIDYPHIQRRQVIKAAETALKVMPVKVTPGLRVGYIVGAGDQVPPAIEQLGARMELVGPEELAWGDLSRYDVIVTGVRAYERRPDLRIYNRRLLDFAERGGTVIVQYNKMEFNEAQYGPYKALVGRGRVTGETAPVKVLVPDHPVFHVPNQIGEAAWQGWVQERGLYFLGEKDPRYVDLIEMEDPFPDNAGVKLGSLVEAKVGKGRWIYVGLALWRQLPAGTEGSYLLLANLISLGKAPATAAPSSGR